MNADRILFSFLAQKKFRFGIDNGVEYIQSEQWQANFHYSFITDYTIGGRNITNPIIDVDAIKKKRILCIVVSSIYGLYVRLVQKQSNEYTIEMKMDLWI